MAPSAEEWEALSPAERVAVVAALPGEVTYDEMALLLESDELIARLEKMCDAAQRRAEEAERLREEEKRFREEAEQEVARLRAELERLKR
jgi:hypothetical protein